MNKLDEKAEEVVSAQPPCSMSHRTDVPAVCRAIAICPNCGVLGPALDYCWECYQNLAEGAGDCNICDAQCLVSEPVSV